MPANRMLAALLLWGLLSMAARAQCSNDVCPDGDCPPTTEATDAPLYCDLNDLAGRTGSTGPSTVGTMPDGFCGAVENGQWYAFVAPSTQITFFLEVENCTNTTGGSGLQMMVFENFSNCTQFLSVSDCFAPGDGSDGSVTATDLTIGQTYYLFLDGWSGDICDYTLTVTEGLAPTPVPDAPDAINGPTAVCPGATVTYSVPEVLGAITFDWTLSNTTVANITAGQGTPSVTLEVSTPGDVTLSVTAANACATSPPTDLVLTSTTPVPPPPDTVRYCLGEPVVWEGDVYDPATPGPKFKTYQTALGCDSTVVGLFVPGVATSEDLGTITICPGEPFQIGTVGYGAAGDYEFVFEDGNAAGCDSTILFTIEVEQVTAQITVTDLTLDCGEDFITLNGSNSTNTDAYAWLDANQVVLATTPNYAATAPGDYQLHVTGPNGCTDTASVSIAGSAQVATVNSIAGTSEICPNETETEIYTANGLSNVDTLLWQVPPDAAFVVLDNTSIEIQWNNSPGGTVCAQPVNACGAGTAVCLEVFPLAVSEIELSGDTTICPDASASLTLVVNGNSPTNVTLTNGQGENFTFSGLSPGVNLIETFPALPTSYSISSTAGTDCPTEITGSAEVQFFAPLAAAETIQTIPGTDTYEVCLELSGGAVPYSIDGSNIMGTQFCQTFDCGTPAAFSVSDAAGCSPLDLDFPSADCGCTNAVGMMGMDSILVCSGNLAEGIYNPSNQELADGDTLLFILHDAAGSAIGDIRAQNDQPEFAFDQSTMNFNEVLFLSPVVAPGTDTGFDAAADCIQVGPGTPVVFLPEPVLEVQLSADTVCRGEAVELTILNSDDLFITIDGTELPLTTGSTTFGFPLFADTLLNLESAVSQRGQCPVALLPSAIEFTVVTPPASGTVDVAPVFCAPAPASIDLNQFLIGADASGVWTQLSGPAPEGLEPTTGVLSAPAVGISVFEYVIANAYCGTVGTSVTLEVVEPPLAAAGADQTLNCAGDPVLLSADLPTGTTAVWEDIAGNFLSDGSTLLVDEVGRYVLRVASQAGDCVATDTVEVFPAATSLQPVWSVANESCFGIADGIIVVDSVAGGTVPHSFSLNGGAFQSVGVFRNLTPGEYVLTVRDDAGCTSESLLAVQPGLEPQLLLTADFPEPDNGLLIGDSLELTLQTSLSPTDSFRLIWQPKVLFADCDTCLLQIISPLESTLVSVDLLTVNGCTASTELPIRIIEREDGVFLPSGFSPNGDGENDLFFPQADPAFVVEIIHLRVFDRWGTLVFQRENLLPNTPEAGWNGQLGGNAASVGVYVYQIEYQTVTGRTHTQHGTTFLVR